MKKIISKPHLYFLGLIPIIFIFGYLNKDQPLNLEYFGGTFSISFWSVSLFSCVFFLLISFNYIALAWTNKPPKKILTTLHLITQTLSFGVFYYYKIMFHSALGEPYNQVNVYLVLSFLLFFLASIIHLINFFTTLISKSK